MNEKDRGRECNEFANETPGLQIRVRIVTMAIPYKKDKALCSPTSALEFGKGRMLSEELRNPYGQRQIYSRLELKAKVYETSCIMTWSID